jgi:hypothetical protein
MKDELKTISVSGKDHFCPSADEETAFLKDNHEVIGDLEDITIAEGKITFSLAIGRKFQVPQSAFAETDLKEYIGDRVGIIHIGGVYKLRRISAMPKKEKMNIRKENEKDGQNRRHHSNER